MNTLPTKLLEIRCFREQKKDLAFENYWNLCWKTQDSRHFEFKAKAKSKEVKEYKFGNKCNLCFDFFNLKTAISMK